MHRTLSSWHIWPTVYGSVYQWKSKQWQTSRKNWWLPLFLFIFFFLFWGCKTVADLPRNDLYQAQFRWTKATNFRTRIINTRAEGTTHLERLNCQHIAKCATAIMCFGNATHEITLQKELTHLIMWSAFSKKGLGTLQNVHLQKYTDETSVLWIEICSSAFMNQK